MKRLIMLIEVEDDTKQWLLYEVLQQMIEERELNGYFTLVDNGKAVEDLPEYMEYERNKLNPMISNLEKDFDKLYHK